MGNAAYDQIQARKVKARLRMLQHAQRVSGNVSQTDPKPENCTNRNWSYVRQLRSSNDRRGGQHAEKRTYRRTDRRGAEAV